MLKICIFSQNTVEMSALRFIKRLTFVRPGDGVVDADKALPYGSVFSNVKRFHAVDPLNGNTNVTHSVVV